VGDEHLPDHRRDQLGSQIDYVDVFAEDVAPRKPWYTKPQVFLFGIMLGLLAGIAFGVYGIQFDRPMWVWGVPAPSGNDIVAKVKTGNWPARTQKILDGEIKPPDRDAPTPPLPVPPVPSRKP
jgi:hypothetical protein